MLRLKQETFERAVGPPHVRKSEHVTSRMNMTVLRVGVGIIYQNEFQDKPPFSQN